MHTLEKTGYLGSVLSTGSGIHWEFQNAFLAGKGRSHEFIPLRLNSVQICIQMTQNVSFITHRQSQHQRDLDCMEHHIGIFGP